MQTSSDWFSQAKEDTRFPREWNTRHTQQQNRVPTLLFDCLRDALQYRTDMQQGCITATSPSCGIAIETDSETHFYKELGKFIQNFVIIVDPNVVEIDSETRFPRELEKFTLNIGHLVDPKAEAFRSKGQLVHNETSRIEDLLRSLSSQQIRVGQPTEVEAYLSHHPDIIAVVETVSQKAAGCLAGRAQLSLEIYHDPEIQDEYLTLYVRQEEYTDDLLSDIDALGKECEMLLPSKSGWLLVTTDFCPPK